MVEDLLNSQNKELHENVHALLDWFFIKRFVDIVRSNKNHTNCNGFKGICSLMREKNLSYDEVANVEQTTLFTRLLYCNCNRQLQQVPAWVLTNLAVMDCINNVVAIVATKQLIEHLHHHNLYVDVVNVSSYLGNICDSEANLIILVLQGIPPELKCPEQKLS